MIRLLTGDCRELLATLPDQSVHCVVTSPPYYGLRDYGTGTWVGGDPACNHVVGEIRKGLGLAKLGERYAGGGHKAAEPKPMTAKHTCPRCGAVRVDSQIGLETTPGEYVAEMVAVFREVWRVLRDDGTVWLNLGDSYANDAKWGGSTSAKHVSALHGVTDVGRTKKHTGLKPKDLMGIPWRVAFALQDDGWYLRCDIIWSKPNPMPESITDRPSKAHEYVFLLTKSGDSLFWTHRDGKGSRSAPKPDYRYLDTDSQTEHSTPPEQWKSERSAVDGQRKRWRRVNLWAAHDYFYDAEAIRENGTVPADTLGAKGSAERAAQPGVNSRPAEYKVYDGTRNARSVWTIATHPFSEAHFATFPPRLAETCILAGTSERGCCPTCSAPWARTVSVAYDNPGNRTTNGPRSVERRHETAGFGVRLEKRTATTGWQPTCDCPSADPVPCVVLDPFGGAGTVGLIADRLQRDAILIELNPAYVAIAKTRLEGDSSLLSDVQIA